MNNDAFRSWHPFIEAKYGWQSNGSIYTAPFAALWARRFLELDAQAEVIIHPYSDKGWAVYYRLSKDRPMRAP